MLIRLDPRSWPITVKVPLAVAVLMMLVALLLSERVLAGLAETQAQYLRELAQSYLDGLSSSVGPSILREDTWEVFDAIERAQELHKGLRSLETVVTNADGRVIAASNPRLHPIGSLLGTRQQALSSPDQSFSFEAGADTASAVRKISYPGRTVALIRVVFDTRHLAAERRRVIITLITTNGMLTLLLAAAGWILVARMMRPVRVLTHHLGLARDTSAVPIASEIVSRQRGEFSRLFQAYNALVRSMDERESLVKKLAEEERLGSLGRLASALAHEINNPLGGLFNALATLKSHGQLAQVRRNTIGLLERGLLGIRDVVRTTLAVYRTEGDSRDLAAADINDLQLLITPEARRKAVTVVVKNGIDGTIGLPSTPVRQAILNLLLNAVAASPDGAEVSLAAELLDGALSITVVDRGPGLPDVAAEILSGTLPTTPVRDGGGLGLWTTRRVVTAMGGEIDVQRPMSGGTALHLTIPLQSGKELPNVA
ncbi:MAG: histidine kinase [Kaistia sp. SCN 65-12]|nr:MAG: histidine kinase [Kaistia sp. SCN 65-12]